MDWRKNSICAWRAARESNPGRHAGAACADASGSAHMGRPRPTESETAYKIVTAQPLRSISGWSCLLPGDGYPAPRAIKRGRSTCRGARERAKGKSGVREPGFEPGFRRRERGRRPCPERTWLREKDCRRRVRRKRVRSAPDPAPRWDAAYYATRLRGVSRRPPSLQWSDGG